MNYQQVEEFLFSQLASYQNIGEKAFNKSLDKTLLFLEHLDNPHMKFKSVHVAGTNGKGSSCSMIASVLQESGYKVGLYTSPHLKRFTERIRINGIEVSESFVVKFVNDNERLIKELNPSFFEITTVISFLYFANEKVDIAVIETGLGGRLDSTNVLQPEVCLITSIGLDHQKILGDSIEEIAKEKAGIIKPNIPVVLGKQNYDFVENIVSEIYIQNNSFFHKVDDIICNYEIGLKGECQRENVLGVLKVLDILNSKGFKISEREIKEGLQNTSKNTGLKGRWQILSTYPLTICDTAHNVDGVKLIVNQLIEQDFVKLFVVFGMVNDKDFRSVLELLPKNAEYIFTQPKSERALPVIVLKEEAVKIGLKGIIVEGVNEAIEYCKKKASKNDMIYIGGSTFVVAEINEL